MADLRDLVLGLFPGAELSESFEERAIYKIPMSSVSSLSQTFAALEEGTFKRFCCFYPIFPVDEIMMKGKITNTYDDNDDKIILSFDIIPLPYKFFNGLLLK